MVQDRYSVRPLMNTATNHRVSYQVENIHWLGVY